MENPALSFGITGLQCGACVGRTEAALAAIPGAQGAWVNLANHSGQVAGVAPDAEVQTLTAAGCPAEIKKGAS